MLNRVGLRDVSFVRRCAFLGIALVFIALELCYLKLVRDDDHHDPREALASIGVALGDVASRVLTGAIAAIPMFLLYENRLFEFPLNKAWSWIALYLGVEFCYFWFHRASHSIRWLWATHSVHHSATHMNLSAAIRLGWTGTLSGAFAFFLPLAALVFHPVAFGFVIGRGLLYQFCLHKALDVHLGPLEWILNTPGHHRVHHSTNTACLDAPSLYQVLAPAFEAGQSPRTIFKSAFGRRLRFI